MKAQVERCLSAADAERLGYRIVENIDRPEDWRVFSAGINLFGFGMRFPTEYAALKALTERLARDR